MKPLLSREKMYFVLWASIQAAHVASFDVGVGAGTLMKPRGLWKSTFLLPEREVKVWLPPGYDEDDQTRLTETSFLHSYAHCTVITLSPVPNVLFLLLLVRFHRQPYLLLLAFFFASYKLRFELDFFSQVYL
jgi:hypothetical protein